MNMRHTMRHIHRLHRPLVSSLLVAAVLHPAVAAESKGNVERAAGKTSMCEGCHGISGYRTSYPLVYSVPYIGGQNERYLASALEAYRKGDREHPTMRAIAEGLSDEDIADLAAYYSRARDAR